MIARTWRGRTRSEDAERYAAYVRETGLAAYVATEGNRGAWLLWRTIGDEAEFLTISLWDSMEAITAFTDDDPTTAVFYPEDDRYLIGRDLEASHYQVEMP